MAESWHGDSHSGPKHSTLTESGYGKRVSGTALIPASTGLWLQARDLLWESHSKSRAWSQSTVEAGIRAVPGTLRVCINRGELCISDETK